MAIYVPRNNLAPTGMNPMQPRPGPGPLAAHAAPPLIHPLLMQLLMRKRQMGQMGQIPVIPGQNNPLVNG